MGRKSKWVGVRPAGVASIEIDFRYRGVRCREKLKLLPTPANLTKAERHRFAILAAIDAGTFDYSVTFPESKAAKRFAQAEEPARGFLLEEYLETGLAERKKVLKSSTWKDYDKTVHGVLIPAIGRKTLAEIRRSDVRDWAEEQTCGNKRLANVQSVLRAALADAVHDELLEHNVMSDWTYERKEAPRPVDDVDPLTAEEQAEVLKAATEPQHRNLIQFAFWSGLRTSELCALQWGDVDWLRGVVRIQRALTQAAEESETPKTKRGAREVKLLQLAREALQAQKAHTYLRGAEIFLNPRTGEPWTGDQAIRKTMWTPILKRAGVRYRRPYQTRHTYASMMLTAGESPVWLAQQMGHSDFTMIARTYGRWIPDAVPDAGGKAEALFGSKADSAQAGGS